MDAIRLLKADHREVEGFFKEFEELDGDKDKQDLVDEICLALTVHATIEEEIFYPAAREQLEDDDLMDEAQVEHASAKQLIAEIQDMQPGDDLFDEGEGVGRVRPPPRPGGRERDVPGGSGGEARPRQAWRRAGCEEGAADVAGQIEELARAGPGAISLAGSTASYPRFDLLSFSLFAQATFPRRDFHDHRRTSRYTLIARQPGHAA